MSQPPAGPPTRHGYRLDEAWDGYAADDDRTAEKNVGRPRRAVTPDEAGPHPVPSVEDDPDLTRMAPREAARPDIDAGDHTRGRPDPQPPNTGIVNGSAPIHGSAHTGEANGNGAGAGLGGAMRRVASSRPHPVGDEDVTVRRSLPEPPRRETPPPAVPAYLDETAPAPEGLDRVAGPEVGSGWFRPDAPPQSGFGNAGPVSPVAPGAPRNGGPTGAPGAPPPHAPPAPDPSWAGTAPLQPPAQDSPWAEPPGTPDAGHGPAQAGPQAPAGPPGPAPGVGGRDSAAEAHLPEAGQDADEDAKPTTLDRVATVVDWLRGREKASEAKRRAKEAGQSPRQRTWSLVRELSLVVIVGVAVTLLLRAFVLQPFGIPSESMQETLMVDDKVVVSKLSDYHRGDILVFRDDHGWLDPAERSGVELTMIDLHLMPDEQYLTKRLIGMPGDRVQFDPTVGKLTVNGYQLEESDYLFADGSGQPVASVKFEVVVPQGHVFMMGDNRSNSKDSRCYLTQADESGEPGSMAFISTDAIVGPAAAVYLPLNRIQTFDTPRTFAGVPDPTQVAPKDPVVVGSEMC